MRRTLLIVAGLILGATVLYVGFSVRATYRMVHERLAEAEAQTATAWRENGDRLAADIAWFKAHPFARPLVGGDLGPSLNPRLTFSDPSGPVGASVSAPMGLEAALGALSAHAKARINGTLASDGGPLTAEMLASYQALDFEWLSAIDGAGYWSLTQSGPLQRAGRTAFSGLDKPMPNFLPLIRASRAYLLAATNATTAERRVVMGRVTRLAALLRTTEDVMAAMVGAALLVDVRAVARPDEKDPSLFTPAEHTRYRRLVFAMVGVWNPTLDGPTRSRFVAMLDGTWLGCIAASEGAALTMPLRVFNASRYPTFYAELDAFAAPPCRLDFITAHRARFVAQPDELSPEAAGDEWWMRLPGSRSAVGAVLQSIAAPNPFAAYEAAAEDAE